MANQVPEELLKAIDDFAAVGVVSYIKAREHLDRVPPMTFTMDEDDKHAVALAITEGYLHAVVAEADADEIEDAE